MEPEAGRWNAWNPCSPGSGMPDAGTVKQETKLCCFCEKADRRKTGEEKPVRKDRRGKAGEEKPERKSR